MLFNANANGCFEHIFPTICSAIIIFQIPKWIPDYTCKFEQINSDLIPRLKHESKVYRIDWSHIRCTPIRCICRRTIRHRPTIRMKSTIIIKPVQPQLYICLTFHNYCVAVSKLCFQLVFTVQIIEIVINLVSAELHILIVCKIIARSNSFFSTICSSRFYMETLKNVCKQKKSIDISLENGNWFRYDF